MWLRNKIRTAIEDDKKFAFLIALIMCALIFSIFIGQALWSDIITFRKNGDDLKQCFPSLLKICEYLKKGKLQGVDTGIFNGATEFFNRSNLPTMYLPVIVASLLTSFLPARGVYLLLYVLQMFVCIYFSMRLAGRFFNLNRKLAILFAASVVTIALYENWYLSHYLVTTLVCPALYAELCALENKSKRKVILYAFPYVLCFTSGYITTSVVLAGFVFVFSVFYGMYFRKDLERKKVIIRTIVPFVIGCGVSFTYCLELLVYMKNVVKNASSSVFDTLYYQLKTVDLRRIFTSAFLTKNGIEQIELITVGFFWLFIIALIIRYGIIKQMEREEAALVKTGFAINIFVVFIALGIVLPFVLWFYSFVPIFGSMHLPLRYLMVTLPVFYLGLVISMKYIPDLKQNKKIKYLALVSLIVTIGILIFAGLIPSSEIKMDVLIMECIFITLLFYSVYKEGLLHWSTVLLATFFVLLPGITFFYNTNEVGIFSSKIEERSIVYNTQEQEELDKFISSLDSKDRYLYAAFDSEESVPDFVPGNYQWYHFSNYNLTNYMGYELQLCLPNDYLKKFWWFDQMDWEYVIDTRGDFLILDDEKIKENQEILDVIIDWENSNVYLDGEHRICKLRKFIPSYYTGQSFILDNPEAMDNGYFYSHDLRNDAIIDFSTDDATYYNITLDAVVDSTISFLLYPNRYYHYYLNGEEIEPIIDDMQVYIPITTGQNEISVVYKNGMAKVENGIFGIYYVMCVIIIIISLCSHKRRRKSD